MADTDLRSRPTKQTAGPRHRQKRRPRRKLLIYLSILPAVAVLLLGVSLVGAVTTPGNESLNAKWADWMRSHHAGALINRFEAAYYAAKAPAKGGAPKHLNPVLDTPSSSTTTAPKRPGLTPPSAVPLIVSPALAGEGQWQAAGPLVQGVPGMYVAQFRADDVYTSQITSAVWIDPTLLHISLIPGASEPGGTWPHPPYIEPSELPHAVAAFNGGFRFQDAHGGFYLDGRTAVPLVEGAASLVIYDDGRVDVGAWGSEVTMTPHVLAVLQNLVPMVDNGQVAPDATYTDTKIWGATLGSATVVARSGIGVTADGALVYVAGPALTAKTLAESLQRAGAVRAMTLDINPEWVTFNFYTHSSNDPTSVTGSKLYPQIQRPASRYLPPTQESRDFFLVSTPTDTSIATP